MSDNVITLGIFAHANAGKTTITENLLYQAGSIEHVGKVDTGNTVTDSLQVERERGISVRAALTNFNLKSKKVQLIDTPGHVDFSAEVERSISVLDAAILVVSGADGIEAQTYPIWRSLRKKNIPTIIFINKMDREGADYNRLIKYMQEELNPAIVPIVDIKKQGSQLAFSEQTSFQLLENLGEFDDECLNAYLEYEKDPNKYNSDWLDKKIKKLVEEKKIFPVIGGSALHGIGVDRLISCIDRYLPPFNRKEGDKFSALVYSIRIGDSEDLYTKILTGNLKLREEIEVGEEDYQKVKDIKTVNGTEVISVHEAKSGDIVILNGLSVPAGSIIGVQDTKFEPIKFVQPLLNMSVKNKKGSMQELLTALKILEQEDPYLHIQHGGKAGEILIQLMGEVQAQVIEHMLKERFNIQAEIVNPTIICKETPAKKGIGKCSYTPISWIELAVEPLPKGSGFIIEDEVEQSRLLEKCKRQAKRLIYQYKNQGLYGWELCDMKVTILDGRFDRVASNTKDFNIAVPLAFFRALQNAGTKVLEPVCNYTIKAEEQYMRVISNSLSVKNGSFKIKHGLNSEIYFFGEAILQNLLTFPLELKKITSGRCEFVYELSSYQPSRNQNQALPFLGNDPRNETVFIRTEMSASLEPLDATPNMKKSSSSKHAWRSLQEGLNR